MSRAVPLRVSQLEAHHDPECLLCAARFMSANDVVAPEALESLAAISQMEHVKAGHSLFMQGDAALWVYNVTSGSVRLTHTLRNGNRQIVGFLFAGDFLGYSHDGLYACSAETIGPVKICRFPRAALEAVSNEQPQLKQRLLDVAVADLVSAQAQIAIMGRQTATEKVASFLLMLARKAAENGRRNNLIQLPMTREDIGDFLGLAFETVSRCLTRLEELHLIALESPRTVRINDFRALEDYFEKK